MIFFREEDLVRYMVRLVAAFPSSYSKPPGSVNMRELLKKMKNFYKLKSLQVIVWFCNKTNMVITVKCHLPPVFHPMREQA